VNEPAIESFGFGVPHSQQFDVLYDNKTQVTYKDRYNDFFIRATFYGVGKSIMDELCVNLAGERKKLDEMIDLIGSNRFCTEYIYIDKHPVLVQYDRVNDVCIGQIGYVKNSVCMVIRVESGGSTFDIDDMKVLANMIQYDETKAPLCTADAELTVSANEDQVIVAAGQNVQFTASFANPDRVNKKNKNDAVVWSVVKAETGEAVKGVSIDAKGLLKVDKPLTEPTNLQVKAASEKLGTSATYNITAIPTASTVTLDPAEIFFYVGTEDTQTVKVILEPATVSPVGLTWTTVKNGIVEITPMEDGVVSIRPLAAGKTDITVKEPGGKNAKLTVNVVAPVESVELKANGAAKAGGKMKIAATLAPKNVGNKAVQWSLDVGEDIATIDEKGQLTISKTAPSGTKITVTCTALGAPSPVVGTLVVEVP